MSYDEFTNRRDQLMDYINSGCLRYTLSLPIDEEKAEQIFLAQPVKHQYKYAEHHQKVTVDMDIIKTFFEGQHTIDEFDGSYGKLCQELIWQYIARNHFIHGDMDMEVGADLFHASFWVMRQVDEGFTSL